MRKSLALARGAMWSIPHQPSEGRRDWWGLSQVAQLRATIPTTVSPMALPSPPHSASVWGLSGAQPAVRPSEIWFQLHFPALSSSLASFGLISHRFLASRSWLTEVFTCLPTLFSIFPYSSYSSKFPFSGAQTHSFNPQALEFVLLACTTEIQLGLP